MDIVDRLQKLDDLIVKNTKPPVMAMLRNELALATEQAEAYQASSDKQDKTLAAQVATIEQLMAENVQLKAAQFEPTATTPPQYRNGLCYLPHETVPICPLCWETSAKKIHLSGPFSPFNSAVANKWECNACFDKFRW